MNEVADSDNKTMQASKDCGKQSILTKVTNASSLNFKIIR